MPPPTRTYRPDFRSIYKNLNAYDREQATIRMDTTYNTITKIVDVQSLDETETASLVQKYTLAASIHLPEKCFEAIMGAIWPPRTVKPFCLVFNSANSTDPVSDSNSAVDTLVENILGVQTAGSTNDVKACKVFRVSDPKFTIAMDDNRLIIEKEGRAVSLLGQLYGQLPIAQSGSSTGNTFDATIDPDTANDTTQTQPSAGPSTSGSPSSDPSSGGLQPSSSTSTFTPNFVSSHPLIRNIRYFPVPSGRELRRTFAFTELSKSGAQTIVLGPRPPPTLPPHVQTSTLPPGHPPQSYGPGAFPPFFNTSGTSSGISSSGAAGIAEEGASTTVAQSVASAPSPASSDKSNKRSRDDEDDEEERTRPTARLYIDSASSQSSLPDDTTTHAFAAASAPTLAPSDSGEGSSNTDSPKKRSRHAEENDEEFSRPSTRTRQESPAIRRRSPTPSDRRTGRIIAPFGTSVRLSPRPSPEADIGSPSAVQKTKEQVAK